MTFFRYFLIFYFIWAHLFFARRNIATNGKHVLLHTFLLCHICIWWCHYANLDEILPGLPTCSNFVRKICPTWNRRLYVYSGILVPWSCDHEWKLVLGGFWFVEKWLSTIECNQWFFDWQPRFLIDGTELKFGIFTSLNIQHRII